MNTETLSDVRQFLDGSIEGQSLLINRLEINQVGACLRWRCCDAGRAQAYARLWWLRAGLQLPLFQPDRGCLRRLTPGVEARMLGDSAASRRRQRRRRLPRGLSGACDLRTRT